MASLCHPFWRSLVITVASFEAGGGNEAIWGRKAITACSAADFSWVSCRNREGSKGLLWWFQTMNERPGNEWQYQVDRIGQQSLQHIRACAHTRTHTHTLRNTHTHAHTHTRTQACLYSTYVYDCMWVCGCVPLSLYGIISELRNAARMQLPFDWGKGARHTLDPAAMAWLFGKSCSSSWKLLATFCSQVMQKHCKASTWMQSNFTMLWYLHKPCFCSAFNMKSRHL